MSLRYNAKVYSQRGPYIMGITKIAYFVYFVRDMARAKNFYADVLNLEIERDSEAWVQFKTQGGVLALHLKEEGSEDITNAQAGGIVGFTVDELDPFMEHLRQHQVKFQGEIRDEHFGRLLNIFDPDGNIINLYEPAHVAHAH